MFDLEIGDKATSAQKFTPTHPDPSIGQNHGLSLMLFGMHSATYKDALVKSTRARMKLLKSRAKGLGIEVEDAELTLPEAAAFGAQMIADCCESYTGAGDQSKLSDKERKSALSDTLKMDKYSWLRIGCENWQRTNDNFFLKPGKK